MYQNMLSTTEIKNQINDLQHQLRLAELDRKIEEAKRQLEIMNEAKTRLENIHDNVFHLNESIVKFLVAVVRGGVELFIGGVLKIHMKDLYEEYRNWCDVHREEALKERAFTQKLMDIGVDKTRPRVNGVQKVGISVLREGLRNKLNTYCSGNINW